MMNFDLTNTTFGEDVGEQREIRNLDEHPNPDNKESGMEESGFVSNVCLDFIPNGYKVVEGVAKLSLAGNAESEVVESKKKEQPIKYSREELLEFAGTTDPKIEEKIGKKLPKRFRRKKQPEPEQHLNVRKLTHQEMVDCLAMGKLNPKVYEEEMHRRKVRREARKMLQIAETRYLSNDKKMAFTLREVKTELSQKVYEKPLGRQALRDMLDHQTFGPWWTKTIERFLLMTDDDIEARLRTLAYSPYKKGTVEYWHDLLWGSRRRRDRFVELFNLEEKDEIATVQGDEPVLEETSTMESSQNITFIEEREVDSDASHLMQSSSGNDQHSNMADNSWTSVNDFLCREIIVARGVWSSVTPQNFLNLGIPKCITDIKNSFLRRQLETSAFLRAGVELRIQFNGNRFAAGSLIFCIVPPMFIDDVENYTYFQSVNFPHIRIDAAVSNVGTLFVPFTHLLSHFPQRKGSLEHESMATLGRLVGWVLNPLKVGEGATSQLNWIIYAKFVNPELHQSTWPISDFAYSDGIITQCFEEIAQTQAAEEGFFKKILSGGLTSALGSFLSKMTGGLATGIGSALVSLIFDYPTDPMPADKIINKTAADLCHGAGLDKSTRLALTSVSQTETTPGLLGSTNGDFNLKVLLSIPSLLAIKTWKATDQPGTEIFSMPVSPSYLTEDRVAYSLEEHTAYSPTMQAYITRMFCYYRGTIIIKIQLAKTEYHNGRLLAVYCPHINADQIPVDSGSTDALEYYNQANAVIFDIEEQKEIEISCPYMSPRPWLRCDAFRTERSFNHTDAGPNRNQSYLAESYMGYFKLFVVNSLTSPSNVPKDVDFNVYISVGSDFDLAYPTTLAPLNIESFGQGMAPAYEEYPFVLYDPNDPDIKSAVNDVDFENKTWIDALYKEGARLFREGRIEPTQGKTRWYEYTPVQYVGSTDTDTVNWCYRAHIFGMYADSGTGIVPVQGRYMELLPDYRPEIAHTQGLEEYTTNRVKSAAVITSTNGQSTSEVAPTTVSENGMNLQTLLRRFYCIYTSPVMFPKTGYTMVAIPVNPSVTIAHRKPILIAGEPYFTEPVPIDHVAWATKLYTYYRGSLRYKIVYDKAMTDVRAVHVPTECMPFDIKYGLKEVDITRIMSYAAIVAESGTQGALEVEVPYASPYEQLFVDVHNKFFDLRCQNGTLFFFFRNKETGGMPFSFQIFRSTGDDFVMNVLKAPPILLEPAITFGACRDRSKKIVIEEPEPVRNLGDKSEKLVIPGTTGIKRLNRLGRIAFCDPILRGGGPPNEMAHTQMFSGIKKTFNGVGDLVNGDQVKRILTSVETTQSEVSQISALTRETLQKGKLEETLQNLNGITSKIDSMLNTASSTASNLLTADNITKYTLIASEVVLCGTFVHHIRVTLQEPCLPNFITLAIEFGLIVGLSVSDTLQGLVARVVNWAMNTTFLPELSQTQAFDDATDLLEENSGIICTVVAVLGTVLYAYLFDALPSFDKIKSVIKNFFEEECETQGLEKSLGFSFKNAHFSLLGITALEKVYNKIQEWVQKLLMWFLDQENPEIVLAKAATEVKDRVLKLIEELDELDYEPNFIASMEDPLVHNRYYKLQQEVLDLTRLCTESKIDQKIVILMSECRRRSQALLKRLEAERPSPSVRYDPFVVCLHGDTGVGKTKFSQKVFEVFKEVMGLSDYHLVFSKNIQDEYWSGYTNQPLVLWDEFGQSRDADKKSIPEFMTLKGDKPVKVNMAALDDKGRNFTSQGIVLTTNTPQETFDAIRDNDALKRRRNLMIGMQHRAGFDPQRLDNAQANEFPNWEHCSFAITDRMTGVVRQAGMTMDQVLDRLRRDLTAWHAKQLALIGAQTVMELPRGVVAVEVPADVMERAQIAIEEDRVMFNARAEDEYEDFYDADEPAPEEIAQVHSFEEWRDYFFEIDPAENLTDAELFLAETFLARLETATAQQVVNTYAAARKKVIRRTSRMYELAKRTFDNLVEKVKRFWNENPKLCKILGVLTLLTGVGAIMHFRTSKETEAYESGPTRAAKVKVVNEHYESGPTRAGKIKIIPEGCEDQQALEISRKIKMYTYPIEWEIGSTRAAKMNCLHVGGHLILAPYHFFNHALDGEWFMLQHRTKPVKVEFKKDRMSRLGERDWVVYDCGPRLEAGKRMDKFFIKEQDLGKAKKLNGFLITRDPHDWEIDTKHGIIQAKLEFRYQDSINNDVYVQTGWEHNIATTVGHCGGALVLSSNVIPSPGKIAGVHVAGYRTKTVGYCVLITQEKLVEAMSKFRIPGPAAIPHCVEYGVHPKMRLLPEGDFSIVGMMPDKLSPAQPQKSTLVRTPFYEEVTQVFGPAPKEPAQLKPFVKDGERISPLKKAIVKYGHYTVPYPQRNLQKVRTYLGKYFKAKLTQHTGKRIFSIKEAVNGLPGVDFAEKMNFKSSAGWPYQMEDRRPGKWHLFDHEGNIIDPKVAERLGQRREAARHLQRVESVWRDCLKDELRPKHKVDAGKTRLFTIAPVDFTILVRQMFMDFVLAFYNASGSDFFSAVGINPESPDWTRIYSYLAEFNSHVVAGDYECFDGKEMAEIIMLVCEIINDWFDDGEENQNIRITLFEEIIHTMQLCENTVYMTHMGNPSGNPLTTIINTIVNLILLILTFLEIFPEKSVEDFFRLVRALCFGDDNLVAPKPEIAQKFNQNTIAQALLKHNIVYTTESKTGEDVADLRPLKECSFLKRGFRKDAEFGNMFYLPTMSLETLNSYFYYYRTSPDVEEQLRENQRSALIFAAFHGREFYENYSEKWTKFMESAGMTPLFISFEEQVDAFLYSAGIVDSRPKMTWTGNGLCSEGMENFMKLTNSKPVRLACGAVEAPFYYLAASLGILATEERKPEDDRWAVAIPSGEGKSYLAKEYPWLFVDHDDLLIPVFERKKTSMPWDSSKARELDFPQEDRRVLLVHHPNNTKRRLVGSFITPFPTFIRMNCIQRLRLKDPIKMTREERNILLVQLCTSLEPSLVDKRPRSELTAYTHGPSDLNQLVGSFATENAKRPLEEA